MIEYPYTRRIPYEFLTAPFIDPVHSDGAYMKVLINVAAIATATFTRIKRSSQSLLRSSSKSKVARKLDLKTVRGAFQTCARCLVIDYKQIVLGL